MVGDSLKHRTHPVPPGASGDCVGQASTVKPGRDAVPAVSAGGWSQGYLLSSTCKIPDSPNESQCST